MGGSPQDWDRGYVWRTLGAWRSGKTDGTSTNGRTSRGRHWQGIGRMSARMEYRMIGDIHSYCCFDTSDTTCPLSLAYRSPKANAYMRIRLLCSLSPCPPLPYHHQACRVATDGLALQKPPCSFSFRVPGTAIPAWLARPA